MKLIFNESFVKKSFNQSTIDYKKVFISLFGLQYDLIPNYGCVYAIKENNVIIYIGCTNMLRTRIKRHLLNDNELSKHLVNCLNNCIILELCILSDVSSWNLENQLIKTYKPIFNKTSK